MSRLGCCYKDNTNHRSPPCHFGRGTLRANTLYQGLKHLYKENNGEKVSSFTTRDSSVMLKTPCSQWQFLGQADSYVPTALFVLVSHLFGALKCALLTLATLYIARTFQNPNIAVTTYSSKCGWISPKHPAMEIPSAGCQATRTSPDLYI